MERVLMKGCEAIAEAVKNTEPIKLTRPPLAEGDLGSIFRKAARQNKRELHALQAKENYKPCRKKCKLFKCEQCWKKSFEEQKKCWDGNLDLTVPQPRKSNDS